MHTGERGHIQQTLGERGGGGGHTHTPNTEREEGHTVNTIELGGHAYVGTRGNAECAVISYELT